ncbi:hypothetical protein JX266_004615 [Neoarthrinium moseri]|nr:hypothetical protein JX266_004615 [Neoarthrinium moseri]
MIISGACAAFASIAMLTLMVRHARHFTKPKEQANILRICAFIPIYAIGTLIEVCAPAAYVYLHPWLEVAQAFAMAAFFILLCRLLASEVDELQDVFLAPLRIIQKNTGHSTTKLVAAYRRTWIFVFQYPIVSIMVAIFTAITESAGVYCHGGRKPYFASLWLDILSIASMGLAVVAVLKTYVKLKVELRPHRAMPKFLAFKLLIGLQFLQQIVYTILRRVSPSPLEPNATLSYTDLEIGIPLLLTSCELVIFSVFFHFAYSVTPYRVNSPSHEVPSFRDDREHVGGTAYRQGGVLGCQAWIAMCNPKEFLAAVKFVFSMHSALLKSDLHAEQSRPLNLRLYAQTTQYPPKHHNSSDLSDASYYEHVQPQYSMSYRNS